MKNKKLFTRALSLMICMIMVLGSVAAGAGGINLFKASAASTFTPRTTAPTYDKYYKPQSSYNPFAVNYSAYGGNCTWYAWGRAYEITNSYPKLSRGNAGEWWGYNKTNSYYSSGSTPKLGAIACWSGGAGHVAVVESINSDGSFLVSESGWSSTYFRLRTVPKNGYTSGLSFQGFIYMGDYTLPSEVTSELEMFLNDSLYNYAYNSDFATLDKEHYRTRNSSKYELSVDPSEKIDGYNSLKIKALEAGADQKDMIIDTQLQNSTTYGNTGNEGKFIVSFFAKADAAGSKMYWRWGGDPTYKSISLSTEWEYYSVVMDKSPEYNFCLHPYIDRTCTVWLNQFQVSDDIREFKPDNGKVVSTIKANVGQKYGSLPTPTKDGYTFAGWYTLKNGGTRIDSTTSVRITNLRVYAHWDKNDKNKVTLYNNYSEKNYISGVADSSNEPINKYLFSRDSSTYRVTIDDDLFQNSNVIKIEGFEKGASYPKDMCLITDTSTSTNDGGVGDEKTMTLSFFAKSNVSNTNMYWRWGYNSEFKTVSLSTNWKQYTIKVPKSKWFSHNLLPYFDTVGTVWLSQLQLEDGDAATDYVPETSGIFDEFTYSGSFSSSTLGSYVPVREGYDFDGWYTSKVGGAKVTSSNDVALGDVKLYAHWSKSECKHNYVVVADTEPTCLNDGSKTFKCSKCGDSYVEAVPAPGHKAGEWTVETAATCTAAGKRVKYCTVCRAVVETETLPAKGHSFGEWKQGAASSCTADGYEYRVCASCGFVENKNVSGTGHSWASEYTVDKAATCTENGSRSIHCTKCSATANSTVIPAKGHSFGNWRTLNEATCTADGSEIRNCSACSATEKRTVAAKGHIWQDDFTVDKEATCSEAGSKSVHCRNCSATKYSTEIAKKPHNVVIDNSVAATCTTAGLTEGSHCLTCGTVIKARTTVPATGHTDMNNDGLCDKCGKSLVPTVYPKLSIRTPSTTTVSYGFTLNLHANVTDLPEGARVVWSMDGSGFELIPSADGMTCGVKSVSKGSATITAKVVDKNGNAVKDANGNEISASQQLTSKAGFFQKIVAFFKKLFGSNMIIPYALEWIIK